MKILILIITIVFAFIKANHDQSPFMEFNAKVLDKSSYKPCKNPNLYLDLANIEESKPENQDKIILYHGETYGAWLFQLILKEFMYPEAPEDWLPLRYSLLEKDIDRADLMNLIINNQRDSVPAYSKIGLSVSTNLVSDYTYESAWYFICSRYHAKWHKLGGLSLDHSLHSTAYDIIRKEFIPEEFWNKFKSQKKIIYQFIQIKRDQNDHYDASSIFTDIEFLFPKTFRRFRKSFNSLPMIWETYKNRNEIDKSEGVALQIIMDKDLADQLTYSSHPFGWMASKKEVKIDEGIPWDVKEIEPFSEFYKEEKNKKDFNQARLAMNNDFRSFPSRVKIKSIAGIMEDPVDYQILKSMIKEMVETNRKKL